MRRPSALALAGLCLEPNVGSKVPVNMSAWTGFAVSAVLMLAAGAAHAANFLDVEYDASTDELVVTLAYRGTNAGHDFSIQWDECRPLGDSVARYEVAARLLDSQWDDAARQEFTKTERYSLEALECRPARVTLHTAPNFTYTLLVPATPHHR